jgi:3-methylfumaryl-CoA hydratase
MKWIEREERVQDDLSVAHARAVAAMLDLPPDAAADAPLPPLWHWFYFPAVARASELGEDGHPRRGGFLPPVALPRRMWAGGRVRFPGALHPGRPAERRSHIVAVEEKAGRSGPLVVVTIAHTILQDGAVATSEEQDLIYRGRAEATSSSAAERATTPEPGFTAEWEDAFTTDPVLLFRFSALTFNGHRIHYDLRYATEVEGYPGLVVHAPLTALALLRSAGRRTGRAPASFAYRAVAPVFCGEEVRIGGRAAGEDTEVWAARSDGRTIMRATVGWQRRERPGP